jgi:large subunit ribosomal protein L9
MEVVLKKDHEKLGKAMDVVNVAESKKLSENREEKKQKEARVQAKQIEKVPCTIKVNVGEEDKLFGSVTSQEIADFLTKEGFAVDKRNIELEEPIKQLGVYSVKITLYKDVFAKLKVWVVKEEA